jgi:hypothetical protein
MGPPGAHSFLEELPIALLLHREGATPDRKEIVRLPRTTATPSAMDVGLDRKSESIIR